MQAESLRNFKTKAPDAALVEESEILRNCANLLERLVAARGIPAERIPDLVQTVWAELAASAPDFRSAINPDQAMRAWLRRVVQSKVADEMRRAGRHPTQSLRAEDSELLTAPDQDPLAEINQEFERELGRLLMLSVQVNESELDARILTMHYSEGKTIAEIAQELGITEDAIKSRQKRLYKKLRATCCEFYGQYFEEKGWQSAVAKKIWKIRDTPSGVRRLVR
jgi:RNA polymerase sigma factor (sigma-70 family)